MFDTGKLHSDIDSNIDQGKVDTVVIGGGQAGLSVGYHLARRGADFVILDAGDRIGDAWRHRWDSLRLFTSARFDALDGMPFPGPRGHWFPTKDEMADYLEAYADRFELPVRLRTRVSRLSKDGDTFTVQADDGRTWLAGNVVVAMSNFQAPWLPPFAGDLDPSITQLHSSEYRQPGQLRPGPVLLVGAGNSASEIAMDLAPMHEVWMSGRDTGHVPFHIESTAARILIPVVFRVLFHRVLTVRTPIGRRARDKHFGKGDPLIRVKPDQLAAAGVRRVPRTEGIRGGRPVLADGQVLDVANVIWCTGYHPGLTWIDLPVFDGDRATPASEPRHSSGVVDEIPGLYFVGRVFLYAMSSSQIQGVGRDAERIARQVTSRKISGRQLTSSVRQ